MPHLRSRCYILCPFAIPLFPEKNCLTRIQNDPYMRFEFTIYIGGKQATKKLLIWCSEFFSPFPTWLCFQLTSNIFLKLYPFKQNYTYYVYNTYWVEREKKNEFSTLIVCSVENLRERCFWTKYPRRLIDRKMWRNLYCIGHERFIGNRYLYFRPLGRYRVSFIMISFYFARKFE